MHDVAVVLCYKNKDWRLKWKSHLVKRLLLACIVGKPKETKQKIAKVNNNNNKNNKTKIIVCIY